MASESWLNQPLAVAPFGAASAAFLAFLMVVLNCFKVSVVNSIVVESVLTPEEVASLFLNSSFNFLTFALANFCASFNLFFCIAVRPFLPLKA